jgi:uncharacterized protein YidB (DUF937 family)
MALLDELLGGVLRNAFGGSGAPASGKGALIQAVLGMLLQGGPGGRQQQAGAGPGGLGSILGGLVGAGGGPVPAGGGLGGVLGGGLGGLGHILEQAGMGDQMKSWISTGQNLPISPDQVSQAFGPSRLGQLADAAGMSHEEAASELSHVLPRMVDGLTPRGSLPQGEDVSQEDLGQLVSRVLAGGR